MQCAVHAQCVHFAMRGVQFAVFTLYTYSVCSTAQCTMHTAVLQYNDATEADVTGAASGALQIAWRGLTLEVGGSLVLFSYLNVCNVAILQCQSITLQDPLDTVPSSLHWFLNIAASSLSDVCIATF